MKTVLALILFLPFASLAQDSCKLKKETDQFTHQAKISTGFVPFKISGIPLSISIDATKAEVDFFFWIRDDSKCFDENSTAQVVFDGERLKANFKNTGSMNCEGTFHFTFKNSANTPAHLQRMADKKISSIKITGNDKSVTDITFNEEQKQLLMKMVNCVIRDSKALLAQ